MAANAVTHGRLDGRGFRLGLALLPGGRLLIEVADPRGECLPAASREAVEGGRGLLIVDALAADRGVHPYPPSGKTVWAEVSATRTGAGHRVTSASDCAPRPDKQRAPGGD
ncbi:ATP-binding protein [Streptomyces sp. NPDC056441]|uniref:ATP-binding protein n=1 Tax=Streptomyces sp. NPDC056441 TaxID=3345817 RepID=UPI00368B73BB